jgi:hypothetical protein
MRTKRAYLIEPGKLEIRETELQLQPDQLLLQTLACGLSAPPRRQVITGWSLEQGQWDYGRFKRLRAIRLAL